VATAEATAVEVHAGLGIEGTVGNRRLRIGRPSFVIGLAHSHAEIEGVDGESWVCLGDSSGPLAAFRLTDQLRPEAAVCVADLRRLGLDSEIVSGDDEDAVSRIARLCGISHSASRLDPGGKLARVKQLQSAGSVVVAIGDGINDAPLLRGADVAMAMGRGSALAHTSADLILVRDSLEEIPQAVDVARRTQRIIRQNLAWAIGYNVAALPLAAFGFVPPWLAAIGMSISSVVVVLNAMRLSRGAGQGRDPGWTLRVPAEVT